MPRDLRVSQVALALSAPLTLLVAGCAGTSSEDVVLASRDASSVSSTTTTTIPPARACAERLPPETAAAQMVMVLVGSPDAAGDVVAAGQVGGYGLRGNQGTDVAAQAAAVAAREPSGVPLFAASDEEGGTVQRLRVVLGAYPAASEVAATRTPAQAGADFEAYAAKVKAQGINMIFGPSIDVAGGSALGSRVFGDDPATVAAYGKAVVDGTRRAGVIPVVKHWPGLGHGTADTHDAASVLPELGALRTNDLVPFDQLIAAGVEAIMVGHGTVPGLTDGQPASRSPAAITGELREREGFDGLVITDSLGMGAALAGTTQPLAAEASIAAGADVALVSGVPDAGPTHARLVDAIVSGRLSAERVQSAVTRVLRLKGVTESTCPVAREPVPTT